jgi:hypothetical protein
VEAQAAILEAITGQHVSELDASVESAQFGLLTTEGTMPDNIGAWLGYHGVECHANDHGTFLDVMQELRDGNKVIVDVDSEALWNSGDALKAFSSQSADHAIWLTGVDANDPEHVRVTINDSGRPDGAGNVYDLHELENMLHHPGFHYVATGHGPSHLPEHPDGYDADHGVFSALDGFLHDHGATLAGVAVAAAMAAAAPTLRRRAVRVSDARVLPMEAAAPSALEAPPALLMLPDMRHLEPEMPLAPEMPMSEPVAARRAPVRIDEMSTAERNKLLRDL